MATIQPVTNGILNGFTKKEKIITMDNVQYLRASETGLDGPDQVLYSEVDTTTAANGRIRIKVEKNNVIESISVPGLLKKIAKNYPENIALVSRPEPSGKRISYTYKEYETQVRLVAKAFIKLGLERHHSVCILGFNSPQWFIADVAAIYAGGFAAGIYTTNSPEACQYCAESSRANIIVVEDAKQLEKILEIKKNLPHLKAIIQYEGIVKDKSVLSWHDVVEMGKKESDDKLESILRTMGVNECCTLVYTSGTVGNPKAVMLSHDNILYDARVIIDSIGVKNGSEVVVSFLPLSHVAAQLVDIFATMMIGATVYFADKNALKGSLVNTLVEARPTIFLGVPRVWEKIYEKMQLVARNNGPIKSWIASWAKAQGLFYNMNKMNGIDYRHWGYLFAKWLVFNKVKGALGFDRCNLFVTAAAPLGIEIKKYFMSLDIPILEAYGMSECSGAHALSLNDRYRLGSVGPTLKTLNSKLDNLDNTGEGEICMGGRHVFMGYLNEPEKTREAKDDKGWLHSGDLGRIDGDGYLYVTGRIKELIITAGGENVPPIHIEHLVLAELPALSNAMLIGDRRKFLTILVTLKTEMNIDTGEPLDTLLPDTKTWLKSIGSKATTLSNIIETRDPLVYKEIEKAIERANEKSISNAQKVQKFQLLPHDFSVPTGELGPTLKVRRNIVQKIYSNLIEEMYK
ncbi:very long-chain-fatty-acid--CoA ligase bubblegum isoform X2 [Leptopilina boulardi]|nr:very long-chain-fatty-acid--CoA ligase bubblegum isoform X2 [Leptopilina boulardi]XP_051175145.1 very long-chain-fatty-acid--CoA ligase bubblegum isoform X2 [Leptopilina boulardi]XP_051175146.1 very long-chain-fatty-acid--CoA ligase bubblegum isoform X2 [Leptopilina boulardi]XP_051175147.1 very long-chain-fatty-acid--CoA ligase bubblegum isoform X2 [Leptopilina boulardi]